MLDSIHPINAGKKRDQAIALLKRFIPDMEDYLTTVRRYKSEFERQERANTTLKSELEASKIGLKERLDAQQLRQKHERLEAAYNAIPEDIRREAQASFT